ncbi:DUF1648 domain-containing protein [Cohnella sp. WQ 127256]|uniref:DUF1648 domain-containing protein n=1 Tax=Cohnella sp. WQ 127256 TaxID=2938790 RepID=UPI0021187E90|nr:DUF1648 domain-containing protein [Cohnella sp. WQ 127256]
MSALDRVQPKLNLPITGFERFLNYLTLFVLIGTILYLCFQWSDLPSTVATHFNGKGEADGWGSKGMLFLLPAISLALYIGLTTLSRHPYVYNYPVPITEQNAAIQYVMARKLIYWINLELVSLFSYIVWSSVQSAQDQGSDGMGAWFLPTTLVVLFGSIAIYLNRAIRRK